MKRLNDMFHLDGERLIKTSNNQEVNVDEEPIFILRGRDYLAAGTILYYVDGMRKDGCETDRVNAVFNVFKMFIKFQLDHEDKMKQPGVTHGR